jgi:RNA methyltransferase, TrmH family
VITSNQNQAYKHLIKLKKKKSRQIFLEAYIYGDDLLASAKKHGLIKYMIGTNDSYDVMMSEELIQSLADYPLINFELAVIDLSIIKEIISNRILILDNVQDPRNVGALIRSAEAFGFLEIVLGIGTADPYHEEALRAAKGSTFAVKFIHSDVYTYASMLNQRNIPLILTAQSNQTTFEHTQESLALVLGNEGQGISKELFSLTHHIFSIPTQGVESLNVSVAGGIAMYVLKGHI